MTGCGQMMCTGRIFSEIIVVIAIFATLFGIKDAEHLLMTTPTALTQKDVETFIGFSLPPEATEIHFTDRSGQDYNVFIRFSLPATKLDSFLSTVPSGLKLQTQYSPFRGEIDADWWQPNHAQIYAGAEYYPGGKDYRLLVDETDSRDYIVYLSVGTTP